MFTLYLCSKIEELASPDQKRVGDLKQVTISIHALFRQYTFVLTLCSGRVPVVANIPTGTGSSLKSSL